ncbi:MAG: hypothetical protein JST27_02415, partial [Bacteroidetes bacterium]|nr:hypothetical protein [Bacteroidota bacterium]
MKKLLLAAIPILLLPLVSQAQLKLGNNPTSIDPSSILELESPGKALLLSRVSLSTTTDVVTVNTPKAGMMVYNTNTSISSSNPSYAAQGAGIYYFDGTGWVFAGNSTANNGLSMTGNNIQLGGTLVHPTTITTTGSNNLEIQSTDIGGTSPEINQGLNVLTTAATSDYAIGSRGRVLVPTGKTVGQTRGVSGSTTVNGTVSSSATGGYFNSKLDGATLNTGAVSTGVSADAEVVTATANYTNALIGGRFGANAKSASAANAIGTYAAGVGSAASNVGVYAAAGNSGITNAGVVAGVGDTATIATAMMTAAMGKNAAVVAVNPTAAT